MKKENNILKIIIIIIAIVLILALAYVAYHYISMFVEKREAEVAANDFENEVMVVAIEDEEPENVIENVPQEPEDQQTEPEEQQAEQQVSNGGSTTINKTTSKATTIKYKEYSVIGTIQIPKTNVKSVVVDKITPSSISAAVGVLYGPGLNEVGNTVLAAHNYRNGTFFSNNKKLTNGDKIYITDQNGLKVEYEVYNSYTTEDTDISYAKRNTNRKT